MSVYAPLLGHLWHTLEAYRLDPRQVIDAGKYRPGDASLSSRRISFAEYSAMIERAVELIGDPALGVRSARFFHPSYLGALGHAWMASACLRTALHRVARFRRMFNEQVQLEVQESPGLVRLVYWMQQPIGVPDVLGDAHVANLLQLCRFNFGPALEPVEITLTLTEPLDPAPWVEHYGPVVRFGQRENSLSISAGDADTVLTGSNPELVELHEQMIERYLMTLDRDNIVDRIRLELINQLPSGRVTEDDLAEQLHMSKRTLHRKLRENQETFRSVLEQVRKNLAKRYIRDPEFSITEVAFLLGYNDTSAFSRAFRSWFDRTPTEARDAVRAA